MSNERVGTLRGPGEVFAGETKIADVEFDITTSQEYTEILTQDDPGRGMAPRAPRMNGTITPKTGRFPLGVLLTLHYQRTKRLNFYAGDLGGSVQITGGPYEAE